MSILGKRNVINKISKVLSLLLTQSEIILSAKADSKLHKSFEAEKATQHPCFSPAMEKWCLGPFIWPRQHRFRQMLVDKHGAYPTLQRLLSPWP